MTTALSRPTPPMVSTVDNPGVGRFVSRTPEGLHLKAVETAKEDIKAGECFQIVVAQRFERPTDADPLDIYRVLRSTNPSPYMYLLRFDDFDIVGLLPGGAPEGDRPAGAAAPDRRHPVARGDSRRRTPGSPANCWPTRRNGPSTSCWSTSAATTWAGSAGPARSRCPSSPPSSGTATSCTSSPPWSASCATTASAFDALAATFPAGTLSGAPKVRAMEIIDELEPTRRGIYGGIVGYFAFSGDLDTAITIRTALLRDGTAYVQAGGGIVADSDPVAEEQETRNKAAAVLAAIAAAETLRPAR